MMNFQKQSQKAEMQQEMMGDAFGMMDGGGVDAEADDLYAGVLGELGLAGAQ